MKNLMGGTITKVSKFVVPSKLNSDVWAQYLNGYWHWKLSLLINVDTYLKDEIEKNAMLGNVHVSPLMTHEKSNSVSRRVLSGPIRESANSGGTPDKYLGTEFILTFPSVDNFVYEELKLRKGWQQLLQ